MAHRAFEFLYLISEIIVIILYLLCTEYSDSTQGEAFFKEVSIDSDDTIWKFHAETWAGLVPEFC